MIWNSGIKCIIIQFPQTFSCPVEHPLKIDSGFDLSPIKMVLFNELKRGKAELKKTMKALRKWEKVKDKM